LIVIVNAFLRWAETAKVAERASAANALGRAFLQSPMASEERRAAHVAMTYMLDDPSPRVRLALAEAIAGSLDAPRAIMMSLAEDQPEIACTVIALSPVLTDADLVDLAGRGNDITRLLIAARPGLSRIVAAALAEIGDMFELVELLENRDAAISRVSLTRIAERQGHHAEIRGLLLDRCDLPSDARHLLVQHVSEALSDSYLVRMCLSAGRIDYVAREASEVATVVIAGAVPFEEVPALVEHLRTSGRLTPAFLMHALCSGKIDFFAAAIVNLSGLDERRVRAMLATGRMHAVRALFESAGLARDVSTVFVEATLLWRRAAHSGSMAIVETIPSQLLQKFRASGSEMTAIGALLDMVEKLHITELRQSARNYASDLAMAAA
jgi:uncharacterized protein (DUF2336 family)